MDKIQIFDYESHPVRVIQKDGQLWFVGKDVCDILEITNYRNAVARLKDSMKGVHSVDTLEGGIL